MKEGWSNEDLSSLSGRREDHRHTIHAIAQSCGLRSIVEDMTQVPTTPPAMHLGSHHAQGGVRILADRIVQRGPEARPAGATLELGSGREHGQGTARAGKGAFAVFRIQWTGVGAFRSIAPENRVLAWGEALPPLCVASHDLKTLPTSSSSSWSLRSTCGQAKQGAGERQAPGAEQFSTGQIIDAYLYGQVGQADACYGRMRSIWGQKDSGPLGHEAIVQE